jgi:hypothetical protein
MVDVHCHVHSTAEEQAPTTDPAAHENVETLIRSLVGHLRERGPDGLAQVFAPLLAKRDEALAAELSTDGVENSKEVR